MREWLDSHLKEWRMSLQNWNSIIHVSRKSPIEEIENESSSSPEHVKPVQKLKLKILKPIHDFTTFLNPEDFQICRVKW